MSGAAGASYPDALSFRPESRVVLIGTTECPRDPRYLPPLPQVEANLRALERLCTDPEVIGLPEGAITTLLDVEHASEITEAIAAAAREATDTLIVYYAGHGLFGTAETPLFLVARNSTDDGKDHNAVRINLVKKAMRESPARKRVLILDCCYSGRAFDQGMSSADPRSAAAPAIDVDGTFGIAAAPGDAKALAPSGETLTRFTGALVEVLNRGTDSAEPVLTLDEVFRAVEARISRAGDAPLPRQANWQKAGAFRLARNRALRGPEIRRLEAMVASLQEELAALRARHAETLRQVEARAAQAPPPAVPERRPLSDRATSPVARSRAAEELNIDDEAWDLMPDRMRRQVEFVLAGRRRARRVQIAIAVTAIGMLGMLILSDARIMPAETARLGVTAFAATLVALGAFCLGAVLGTPARPFRLPEQENLPREVQQELKLNTELQAVLESSPARAFGLPYSRWPLAWVSVPALLLGGAGLAGMMLP